MPTKDERRVGVQLELTLRDYHVEGASVGFGPQGGHFACTVGPLSDEALLALDRAAETHGTICLLFPQPLFLELVTLERREPQRVRIVGHIVGSRTNG